MTTVRAINAQAELVNDVLDAYRSEHISRTDEQKALVNARIVARHLWTLGYRKEAEQ